MKYQRSNYFMETDELTEVARLIQQDSHITEAAGLLPDEIEIRSLQRILDIGCGPGGWLLSLANANPNIAGVGIDISEQMLKIASALQLAEGRNLTFRSMDARDGLAFPDCSFDFIQMRLCMSFLLPPLWPPVLQECYRVLVPGGSIWITDLELIVANKEASDQTADWLSALVFKAGRSFSHTGRSSGILCQINPLLRAAGFAAGNLRLFPLDTSKGTKWHTFSRENSRILFEGIFQQLVDLGYDPNHLTDLYEQSCREAEEEDFSSVSIMFSALGQKPQK